MARIPLAILLAVLATLAIASVPSFCKCICGKESYIIELGTNNNKNPQPPPPAPKPSSSTSTSPSTTTMTAITTLTKDQLLTPRESSTSCKQCNRAFCLSYNLPICKDAEEKDIKTTCFQRDSRKDQVIVWGFLLGTAGLLGWAALRRVVDSAKERSRSNGQRLGQGQGAAVHGMGGAGGGAGRLGVGSLLGGLSGGGWGGTGENIGRGVNNGRGRGGESSTGLYNPLEDLDDGGAAGRTR